MNIDIIIVLVTNALLRLEPSMQKEFAYMMLRLIRECSKLSMWRKPQQLVSEADEAGVALFIGLESAGNAKASHRVHRAAILCQNT